VWSGAIEFCGEPLDPVAPARRARLGIAHVPEGRGTFAELTVWENLRLGAHVRRGSLKDDFARVLDYFPWLESRRSQQAGTLSGGEQQMLALARAVMQRPRLLLLDEPSLGLAPLVAAEIFRIVRELNEREGAAVLLVEQNARTSLAVAARAYVLEAGEIAYSGTSDELSQQDSIRRSYLGY
jgi:branched-chain amino acid transport system ATP-binding protein